MARSTLTVQETSRTGLNLTTTAGDATNDHSVDNTGQNVIVQIVNGGAGTLNVTFPTPGLIDGDLTIQDRTVAMGAGTTRYFGPFRKSVYNQADAGNSLTEAVLIDIDVDTSVTLAAFKLGSL